MALTKLEIRLEAQTTKLQKDLDKAKRKIKKWARRSNKAAKSVNQAFKRIGLGAALAAGAIGLLVKNSLKANDALAKTADKLGTTTEKLAGLQHAAELTGVAQETLNKALTKQQKAIFDADRGLLTYSQHFDKLGLSTKKLMELDPVDQFKAIGEALNKVENQTVKTAIAYDIFGGRGTALLNTLALGKKGLEEIALEAKQLGIAMNRVNAAKIEEANDTFTRMKGVVKGVGNSLTIALAPILAGLGKMFVNAAKESGGMVKFVEKGMNKMIGAVGFVADAFHGLKVVWKGLEVAFAATANVIIGIIQFILTPFKAVLKALSHFSDTAGEALMFIEDLSLSTMRNLIDKQAEFNAVLAEPPPSEGMRQWVDEQIEQANRLAEAKAEMVAGTQGGGQAELQAAALKEQQEREAKHQKKMLKLAQVASKARFSVAKGLFGNLASLMDSGNRREFEIGKQAAKATAIIKGIEAVQSAYAAGNKVGGPWVGAAYALTAAIVAKKNVDAISSQQFSGGGTISSQTTSGSVANLTDIPSQQEIQGAGFPTEINISIDTGGAVIGREAAESIVEGIRDLFNDGGRKFA